MNLTKVCTNCQIEKPISEFRKQSSTKTKTQYICRDCGDALAKARYSKKKAQIIQKAAEYQSQNKEGHNKANKKYYNSPLARFGRDMNRLMDKELGTDRPKFKAVLGMTPKEAYKKLKALSSGGEYGEWRVEKPEGLPFDLDNFIVYYPD